MALRIRKYLSYTLLVLAVLLPSTAFAAETLEGTFHQTIMLEGTIVAEFEVALKGEKVRAEQVGPGPPTVIIHNEQGIFNLIPETNMAFMFPKQLPGAEKPNIVNDIGDFQTFLEEHSGLRVGEETIGEYACDIYEFDDPMSGAPGTAWVWKERNFPIRIDVRTPEGLLHVTFGNIDLISEVDDGLFYLSPETTVMGYQDMMRQVAAEAQQQQERQQEPPPVY